MYNVEINKNLSKYILKNKYFENNIHNHFNEEFIVYYISYNSELSDRTILKKYDIINRYDSI